MAQEVRARRRLLSYWQAIEIAHRLGRRKLAIRPDDDSRPLTVAEALDRYQSNFTAKEGALATPAL